MSIYNVMRNEDIIPQLERVFSLVFDKPNHVHLTVDLDLLVLRVNGFMLLAVTNKEEIRSCYPLLCKVLGIPQDVLKVTSLELTLEPDSLPVLALTCHPTSKV